MLYFSKKVTIHQKIMPWTHTHSVTTNHSFPQPAKFTKAHFSHLKATAIKNEPKEFQGGHILKCVCWNCTWNWPNCFEEEENFSKIKKTITGPNRRVPLQQQGQQPGRPENRDVHHKTDNICGLYFLPSTEIWTRERQRDVALGEILCPMSRRPNDIKHRDLDKRAATRCGPWRNSLSNVASPQRHQAPVSAVAFGKGIVLIFVFHSIMIIFVKFHFCGDLTWMCVSVCVFAPWKEWW